MTGSSDAHTPGAVGSGVTRFAGHTSDDLRIALAAKQTVAEGNTWPIIEYDPNTLNFRWNTNYVLGAASRAQKAPKLEAPQCPCM